MIRKPLARGMTAALLLAMASLLASCQREEAADLVSIKGKIFIFNVRLARAYAELTLTRHEGVPDGAMVTASFENPAGGAPLVAEQKVFPAMNRIDLQSPDMRCIVKDRPYAITIRLVGSDGAALQTIETTIVSSLDQTILPKHSLVTGPAYDRNAEAMGKDGKFILSDRAGCPGG